MFFIGIFFTIRALLNTCDKIILLMDFLRVHVLLYFLVHILSTFCRDLTLI
jgi:hypothetical protein